MDLVLVGGPLDGSERSIAAAPSFVWVSHDLRFFKKQGVGRGRVLYRNSGRRGKRTAYLYAGHTHQVCPGCEGYTVRQERCVLCGTGLKEPA